MAQRKVIDFAHESEDTQRRALFVAQHFDRVGGEKGGARALEGFDVLAGSFHVELRERLLLDRNVALDFPPPELTVGETIVAAQVFREEVIDANELFAAGAMRERFRRRFPVRWDRMSAQPSVVGVDVGADEPWEEDGAEVSGPRGPSLLGNEPCIVPPVPFTK